MEAIRGDVLSRQEMQRRGIVMTQTERGGIEFRTRQVTIAQWLIDEGFIERHHADLAAIFMDLRRAYDASMGVKWLAIRDQLLSSLQLSSGQATELYDAIRHELGVRRSGNIHNLISHAMLTDSYPLQAQVANVYRQSFEILSKAMKNVRESKKDVAIAF